MESTNELKFATKISRIVDVVVRCEAPSYCYRPWYYEKEGPLLTIEKNLVQWVKEFEGFLRDHRSQDLINLSVERVSKDVCSACGEEWEAQLENGIVSCAYCGAIIDVKILQIA